MGKINHFGKCILLSIAAILLFGLILFIFIRKGILTNNQKERQQDKICPSCNIVLIDIDILRADALSCYGYTKNITPNICNFAKSSAIFKDNYSNASWTLPSMISTLTSTYPTFHGVRSEYIDKLSTKTQTLAEILRLAGYETFLVSPPALIGRADGYRGYDHIVNTDEEFQKVVDDLKVAKKPMFIHYYNSSLHLPYLLPENAKPIENLSKPFGLPITMTEFDSKLNLYLKKNYANVFTEKAIKQYKSEIFSSKKNADNTLAQLFYRLKMLDNQSEYLKEGWSPIYDTYLDNINSNNLSHINYLRMLYDTKLSLVDDRLGPKFDILGSKPVSDNTITIIMSDHGESFGEHGTFSHDDNHHTDLFYTPLIVHLPKLVGRQINQTTSNIDIMPTLLELVNIKTSQEIQGDSLIPYINNPNNFSDSFALSEDYTGGTILQNKKWLFYLSLGSDKPILYNKITDPHETNDVASEYPQLTKTLFDQAKLVQSYNNKIVEKEMDSKYKKLNLDPEKVKILQKGGYF